MNVGRIRILDTASPRARVGLELAALAILFLLALALRVPHLQTIPPLTDEFKEVGWALDMYETGKIPLVAFDSYDGPLFTYLLAFLFSLLGTSIELPRVVVLVLGALTVVTVYFFGKVLARGDWRVGALAAVLLAVNAHHILFNSHVAWSNDTTPLFATLTLLTYIYATRYARARWLIAAGALYGLALQTHPTALALAPGLTLDFFARRETRAWLRTPLPYLALCAALLAYSPVLIFNLQNEFDTVQTASGATYALETAPSLSSIWNNAPRQWIALSQVSVGVFDDAARNVVGIVFGAFTLASMIWMARRGEAFPLIAGASAFLFFVVFNRFTAIPDSARYFQIFLPIVFVSWSQAGVWIWERAQTRGARWRWAAGIALTFVFFALAGVSLISLNRHYTDAMASGRNNAAMLEMITRTRAPQGAPLLIEWELAKLRTGRGGNVADNLVYLTRLDKRKANLVSTSTPSDLGGLQNFLREQESAYFIGFTDAPQLLGEEFPLTPLVTTHFPCPSCPVRQEFALYWWEQP